MCPCNESKQTLYRIVHTPRVVEGQGKQKEHYFMESDSTNNKGEYFINAEDTSEMVRLTMQDRSITEAMGGLFAERSDLDEMHTILDLGCGPGQWVLDVAFHYPHIDVTGIDISESMVKYARARAYSQGLKNAYFQVMDITQPLAFSDSSIDLINGRLIAFLAPQTWTHLLHECTRILQPGGVLRLTESEVMSTSPALDILTGFFYSAMMRAGQSFSPTGRILSAAATLPHQLRKAGFRNVQHRAHALDFSVGTEAHGVICQETTILFTLMQPFLIGTGVTTEQEFQRLLHQMQIEMLSDDFCAIWFFLTAWGERPEAA
jgi:ubiquinone/menaquinone biosynthesis C-methylase UbiE